MIKLIFHEEKKYHKNKIPNLTITLFSVKSESRFVALRPHFVLYLKVVQSRFVAVQCGLDFRHGGKMELELGSKPGLWAPFRKKNIKKISEDTSRGWISNK